MRVLILIFFVMSYTFAQNPPIEPGVSHELAKWRAANYSDVRYKLNLTLEKMSPVLKGTIEVRVTVRVAGTGGRGGAAIVLDWRKIRGYEDRSAVSNVVINGKSAQLGPPSGFVRRDDEYFYDEVSEHLVFKNAVVPGENVIKLDFTSPILPSGSAITRYVDKEDGAEYIYSLFVPSDASTAFPVFDQPDLKARFTLSVLGPPEWNVVSNGRSPGGAAVSSGSSGLAGDWFEETKPISTYVFAFAAGPWAQVSPPPPTSARRSPQSEPGAVATGSPHRDEPAKGNPVATAHGSDLLSNIYVRKSQAAKFQSHAAEVFRLNREGIKFLEQYFDYKFPFPKYDLVLIPEFPFRGMEHAGATFLREDSVIFPQEPTKNDYISRANVIFHEAAHQWFGDTVTMRWFDDLWLKEGFAEFMAYKTLEKVMPEYNAWKVFYERNKQAAYLTDSTKGTTPIYQEIKNLNSAKSAYGNIVYRKAPSFLKQAEFYIGPDKFQTAVRSFLKKHQFANASWKDLVQEFEEVATPSWYADIYKEASAERRTKLDEARRQETREWSRNWVEKRGIPFVSVRHLEIEVEDAYQIFQVNRLNEDGEWKNDFNVLVAFEDGSRKTYRRSLGKNYETAFMRMLRLENKRSVFLFPNYQDYGYGIFLLDDKSRDYVLKNIQNEKDDFLRSMMWGSLWDSVREGELDPKEYVELVIRVQSAGLSPSPSNKRDESRTLNEDETTTATLLSRVLTAMTYYVSDKQRENIAPRLETLLIDKMRTAATLGQRITYYRAFLNVASSVNARAVLKEMLATKTSGSGSQQSEPGAVATGSPQLNAERGTRSAESNPKSKIQNPKSEGIPLKTKDRFDIVTRLLILNDPDAPKLLADLEKTETSDEAKRYAYAARASIASAENKAKYWNDFTANKEISESWIEAAFGPFNSVRHADLTLPYLERALKELPNHKRSRKIFFVNGWLAAFIGGQRSEEALAIVNKFLADNPDLDRDLRLKILENVDLIERAVKIRNKFATR